MEKSNIEKIIDIAKEDYEYAYVNNTINEIIKQKRG